MIVPFVPIVPHRSGWLTYAVLWEAAPLQMIVATIVPCRWGTVR
jgi:hypothetical protein